MPGQLSSAPPFSILIVCTGNICRSALAERLGRAYLDAVLGEDAPAVRVSSAGTHAVVGSGMHPDSALVLRGLGGDPEGFTATQLGEGHVLDADLILTMTRGHRQDVLTLAPRALSRAFTVREAAALVPLVGEGLDFPGADRTERARALVKEMATVRSRRGSGHDDDIRDPIGRPLHVHQDVGDAIAAALLPVLAKVADRRGAVMSDG